MKTSKELTSIFSNLARCQSAKIPQNDLKQFAYQYNYLAQSQRSQVLEDLFKIQVLRDIRFPEIELEATRVVNYVSRGSLAFLFEKQETDQVRLSKLLYETSSFSRLYKAFIFIPKVINFATHPLYSLVTNYRKIGSLLATPPNSDYKNAIEVAYFYKTKLLKSAAVIDSLCLKMQVESMLHILDRNIGKISANDAFYMLLVLEIGIEFFKLNKLFEYCVDLAISYFREYAVEDSFLIRYVILCLNSDVLLNYNLNLVFGFLKKEMFTSYLREFEQVLYLLNQQELTTEVKVIETDTARLRLNGCLEGLTSLVAAKTSGKGEHVLTKL